MNQATTKFSNKELEMMWLDLGNIPFVEDPVDEVLVLSEDWTVFKKGMPREIIWGWFDNNHGRGLVYLMDNVRPKN